MLVDVAFTPAEHASAPVAAVVDVLRATSTMAQALASGYRRILCCAELEEARALKAELPEALVGGERKAVRIEDFDVGASPREFLEARAETLILSTTNGTRTILTAAESCDEVLLGSLLNLEAVVRAVRERGRDAVVICAGSRVRSRSTTRTAPAGSSRRSGRIARTPQSPRSSSRAPSQTRGPA